MSDVDINLGWGGLIAFLLMLAFWPLLAGAVVCGLLYWRARVGGKAGNVRYALAALIVVGLPLLASGATWATISGGQWLDRRKADAYHAAHSRTLAAPETIGKVVFPAGTVIFDDASVTEPIEATLPGPRTIAGIPTVDTVQIYADSGLTGKLTLTRDATIDGVACSKDAPAGFSEGHVSECHLAKPVRLRGIPCMGDMDRDGHLSCTLADSYRSHGILFARGTDWQQFADTTVVEINAAAPDVLVFGKKLESGSVVRLQGDSVEVDVYVTKDHCDLRDVTYTRGEVVGTDGSSHTCTVRLPASTFAFSKESRG